jgi:hypothetical protein
MGNDRRQLPDTKEASQKATFRDWLKKPAAYHMDASEAGEGSRLARYGRSLSKLWKFGGAAGSAIGLGLGAYDLYQTAQQSGWKEALSAKGGAVAGSAVGGLVGGALLSVFGPVGTMVGASVGSFAGEKLGSWVDRSGFTRGAVDFVSHAVNGISSWWKKSVPESVKRAVTNIPPVFPMNLAYQGLTKAWDYLAKPKDVPAPSSTPAVSGPPAPPKVLETRTNNNVQVVNRNVFHITNGSPEETARQIDKTLTVPKKYFDSRLPRGVM